jgi:probable rRNA maturation factor
MPSSDPGPRSPAPQGATQSWLDVDIVLEDEDWPDPAQTEAVIRGAAEALARHAGMRGMAASAACVALSSDAQVQVLNAGYRGMDKPTNVLSFPAPASPVAQPVRLLGDVALARETVQREAGERGISVSDHLAHLTIHGLLHLLGYDHETDDEAIAMERLETEILAGLGIADPYGDREV